MRACARALGFAVACAWFVLVPACTDSANTLDAGTVNAGTGATGAHDAGIDAADPFGNSGGSAGDPEAELMLIDDGGAGKLLDGAIVYLALWARPCPSDSALTYESFGKAFFKNYCLHCHSSARTGAERNNAPADVNFDTLDAIRERKDDIFDMAGDTNTLMPAAGTPPSAQERHQLGDWLACGARSADDPPPR